MPVKKKATAAEAQAAGGQRPTQLAQRLISVDKVSYAKAWRAEDRERVDFLKKVFRDGDFNKTLFASVTVREEKSLDDWDYVENGQSTVRALAELLAEYDQAAEDDDTWEGTGMLLKVFAEGMHATPLQYEDDSVLARKLWNAQLHLEDNNTFRPTTLFTMYECGVKALEHVQGGREVDGVIFLCGFLGKSSNHASVARRWILLGKMLKDRPDIVQILQAMPALPAYYILDNHYFLGSGVNAHYLLSEGYCARALQLLHDEMEVNKDVWKKALTTNVKSFKEGTCKAYKITELWIKSMHRRYGKVAIESAALGRLEEHLLTRSGVAKILQCAESRTELHGTSEANPGILECRALVNQFELCKAGGPPPPAVSPAAGSADQCAQEAGGQRLCMEFLEKCAGDSASLTPEEEAVLSKARGEMHAITHCETVLDVLRAIEAFEGKNVTVILEAPTSKKLIFSQFVDAAHEIYTRVKKSDGFRVVISYHDRLDLAHEVKGKFASKFGSSFKASLVLLAQGEYQHDRRAPRHVHVLLHTSCLASAKVPFNLSYKGGKPCERLMTICDDPCCSMRSESARKALLEDMAAGKTLHESCEVHGDHKEEGLLGTMFTAEASADPQDEEEDAQGQDVDVADALALREYLASGSADQGVSDAQGVQKKSRVTLFPFTNSQDFYSTVSDDLGKAPAAEAVVILTTTAHPSSWFVAAGSCRHVFVYVDRASGHSLAHGKDIALKLYLQKNMAQLSLTRKRMLTHDDDDLIQGPTLDDKAQVMTAYEVSRNEHWASGLNVVTWHPEQLLALVDKQIVLELDRKSVGITASRENLGRGLVARHAFKEGDLVLQMPALFFDDAAAFKTFVGKHGWFYDKTVVIRNVLAPTDREATWAFAPTDGTTAKKIYASMVGLAQNVKSHVQLQQRPNCDIVFEPHFGFNNSLDGITGGALALYCRSKNKSGIAAGSELAVNFGVSGVNMAAEDMLSSPSSKKFKGGLDLVFETQAKKAAEYDDMIVSVSPASDEKKKAAKAEAAKKEEEDQRAEVEKKRRQAEAERKAETEKKQKLAGSADKEAKLAGSAGSGFAGSADKQAKDKQEAAAKAEAAKKREAEQRAEVEKKLRQAEEEKTVISATTVTVAEFKNPFEMELLITGEKLVLQSKAVGNKKVMKDFVFKKYTDAEIVLAANLVNCASITFDLATDTLVYAPALQTTLTLKKLWKDPAVINVFSLKTFYYFCNEAFSLHSVTHVKQQTATRKHVNSYTTSPLTPPISFYFFLTFCQ